MVSKRLYNILADTAANLYRQFPTYELLSLGKLTTGFNTGIDR